MVCTQVVTDFDSVMHDEGDRGATTSPATAARWSLLFNSTSS